MKKILLFLIFIAFFNAGCKKIEPDSFCDKDRITRSKFILRTNNAAQTNGGSVAPWMYYTDSTGGSNSGYETIWRDLVDLYEFMPQPTEIAEPLTR